MSLLDFRSIYLPYCLKKQENGEYIVLNREYKPLGFNSYDHFEYSDYPISSKLQGITKKTAERLSFNNSPNTDEIYLYNDGTIPNENKKNMDSYLEKISILSKLKSKDK